jgi:CelD/BcsL family acetyltransferase involved in cellulose biosynthesis
MPYMEDREGAPRLRLDGRDFAGLEKGWSSSHRIDVRRQRKRLAEQGPVALWLPTSVEEALPVLNEFFDVHDQKWLDQGFPGMFQDPANRAHYQALVRRLWGRGLLFSTVKCGDTHVSYAMAFFSGGWIQWYRPSYRSQFHNYSPSKIHIALLLEEACRQQWQGFDFLLGEEPYKKAWANDQTEVVGIHAGFSKWSPAYFWFSKGKPFVRVKLAAAHIRMRARIQKLRLKLKGDTPKGDS